MPLTLNLRSRLELFKGSDDWTEIIIPHRLSMERTAILLCDVWDHHWCKSAEQRCDVIAHKINTVIEQARQRGATIVHAPSDCMEFYKDAPQRKFMQSLTRIETPEPRQIAEPPLPIDDSDGGCDDTPSCPLGPPWPWTRQSAAIRIADEDGISDVGAEVYSLLRRRNIETLLMMGVHTNMCVLGRSFAIRQMTRWGVPCVLVRDLTDSMYNPRMRPFVSHDEGTELVIQHIEKYWCPTVLSADLTA